MISGAKIRVSDEIIKHFGIKGEVEWSFFSNFKYFVNFRRKMWCKSVQLLHKLIIFAPEKRAGGVLRNLHRLIQKK